MPHAQTGLGAKDPADGPRKGLENGDQERSSESPAERSFRPDVEGLRAVAVLLVVLYHAKIPGIRGGFVGVDVFFVISGYLITRLLVKERFDTGRTSILKFYARRARRILPAATLVVVLTVLASYHWLGFIAGNQIADDAKWTAFFMANFHFAAIGTSYLGSQAPPSPLQHMWSLGVEEQFYVVWPTLLLLVGLVLRRVSLRAKLLVVLVAIIAGSLTWSIIETSQNATWAYFSPLTRAWELALGGLVAVAAPYLIRVPTRVAAVSGLAGLAGIVISGVIFSDSTAYPGSAVVLPVLASGVVISAGSAVADAWAERLLALRVFQWIGKRSYSFYLFHWPVLIVAQQHFGHDLPVWQNALLMVGALGASAVTFRFVEDPIRRSRPLQTRAVLSIVMGVLLVLATFGLSQAEIASHGGTSSARAHGSND